MRKPGRTMALAAWVLAVAMSPAAPITAAATAAGTSAHSGAIHRDENGDEDRRDHLIAQLQTATGGTARIGERDDGDVTFIGGSSERPLLGVTAAGSDPGAATTGFLARYASMFGLDRDGTGRDGLSALAAGEGGATSRAVRYQQTYLGLPVIAAQIAVQTDASGSVVSASGELAADLQVDTTATVDAESARASAIAAVARIEGIDPAVLAGDATLSIYDPTLLDASLDEAGQARVTGAARPRLTWQLDVRSPLGDVDRFVLVDAHTGELALQFSQRADGLHREICDNANAPLLDMACTAPVRSEGSAPVAGPGATDVNAAYDQTAVTYGYYLGHFGRDSLDGAGMTLRSTVRYCNPGRPCPYDNAFWNGEQMVYGEDYPLADDIVGHELTHGFTQHTSGLFYYADAGAINESISDVMGELIDQSSTVSGPDPAGDSWLLAEQLPGGAFRSMKDPTVFGDPDRMTSTLFAVGTNDSRGVHTNSGVNNKAAYLMAAGGVFNGRTIAALGNDKVAAIYYQASTALLTPGSDYLDLANILPQACTNLIGVPQAVGAPITAGDCQQVTNAVVATEMGRRPTKPGATLLAPLCASAADVVNGLEFVDDMESDTGNWASTATGNSAAWEYSTDSSQSGERSLHVADRPGPRGISTLEGQFVVHIPDGTTYLRFDHSFDTDYSEGPITTYDGGVVEFSTDAVGGVSGTWTDIASLAGTVNGYNTTIANTADGEPPLRNELAGRAVFGVTSPNYQETRVNFSSLAGRDVRIRFRFATDNFAAGDPLTGWFVDDVALYSCGAPRPAGPARAVAAVAGLRSATVTWTPPLSDGASPITGYTITPFIDGVAQPTIDTGPELSRVVGNLRGATAYTFRVATRNALGTGESSAASAPITTLPDFVPLVPTRVLETRAGHSTVDGQANGIGVREAGSVTALTVAGRGGVATDATSVVLNVTVTEAQAPGYVTVYPCGADPPTASNLNYLTGSTVPNLVAVKVGVNGQICLFTQSAVHLIADVAGYFPPGSSLTPLVPARLLESRADGATIDGQANAIGQRPAGSVTEVQVTGRAGVPADAAAAVLNVTVSEPEAAGYVTVYPCGAEPPTASNVNYTTGATVPNAVVTKIGIGGRVCVFTQSATHVIVDVNGYFPPGSALVPLSPARVLESRPAGTTIDGQSQGIGVRPAGSVTEVQVIGRAGVTAAAAAVVLNVTVTESQAPGYATVYPCGAAPPTASNLNYGIGSTTANAVITKIGVGGKVCIFTQQATHLLADVTASFSG